MIDSGKRVVVFMDHDADITTIPYIIDGQSLQFFVVKTLAVREKTSFRSIKLTRRLFAVSLFSEFSNVFEGEPHEYLSKVGSCCIIPFVDGRADAFPSSFSFFTDEFNTLSNAFPCIVNRTTGDSKTQLMLTNHFLDVGGSGSIVYPDKANIVQTNSQTGTGSLGLGAQTCSALHGRYPK